MNRAPNQLAPAWLIERIERRVGRFSSVPNVCRSNSDDRVWFAQNQKRSHRARTAFFGEFGKEIAAAPAGYTLVVLLQQIEPGCCVRTGFYINTRLLPLPDDEATIHALFEMAVRREPMPADVGALDTLIKKYTIAREPNQ